MSRVVQCVVLKREAEGLEQPPHPGEIGIRIYENVSREGWLKWLHGYVEYHQERTRCWLNQ